MTRVVCPYCGYVLPIFITSGSNISGAYIKCKGRGCKRKFSLLVIDGKQWTDISKPALRVGH